jgi:NAD(P)-dependent dehydrogenase (short-subunit alcohol dehydrogenase family)
VHIYHDRFAGGSLMTLELAGTHAFVTGGGSGIGRASAAALAALGGVVTIADRDPDGGRETVQQIAANGGSAQYLECDVADEDSVRAAVDAATDRAGRLDFGVNCAGIAGPGSPVPIDEYDCESFDRMIAVNLKGVFLCTKHELRRMRGQSIGSIVNISSGAGLAGVPGTPAYCASKHGVVGLSKSAALDGAADNIRVNAICPGLVDTPMIAAGRPPEVMAARVAAHPLGRIADASEIADAVVWLCSNRSSFVTGIALPVDGGYTAR